MTDHNIATPTSTLARVRFWQAIGVTSAKDERGTGQGWPSERKNSLQNLVAGVAVLTCFYVMINWRCRRIECLN